jgi:hypothetical protein
MQGLTRLLLVITAVMTCLFVVPLSSANSAPPSRPAGPDKPPQGGEWSDEFWSLEWIFKPIDTEVSSGHLVLMLEERLHWTQTWTAHFADGEFFHTEAISDAVRLASDGMGQYYTTGTFTSTVFYAGRAVDWSAAEWAFLGIPGELTIEYRTGNTSTPDDSWTDWAHPGLVVGDLMCVYVIGGDDTKCETNMSGIQGSKYVQYRGSFSSQDPAETVALYQIDLEYGIHAASGVALSTLISPVDLREWASVAISSTTPASTTLAVDILAPDGTVLLENASDGDSLAGIDPGQYPGLQLRAALATLDPSLTPDVDLWGLSWTVRRRVYLPLVVRHP